MNRIKYPLFVSECDCGEFGTCSFHTNGSKTCDCKDTYKENNGKCEGKIIYVSEIVCENV